MRALWAKGWCLFIDFKAKIIISVDADFLELGWLHNFHRQFSRLENIEKMNRLVAFDSYYSLTGHADIRVRIKPSQQLMR